MRVSPTGGFRGWLNREMDARGLTNRGVARQLAEKHPAGVTPQTLETYRRAVRRYRAGEKRPNEQTRQAFAEVFGVDPGEVPGDDEEPDLEASLQAMARDLAALRRQLARAVA